MMNKNSDMTIKYIKINTTQEDSIIDNLYAVDKQDNYMNLTKHILIQVLFSFFQILNIFKKKFRESTDIPVSYIKL